MHIGAASDQNPLKHWFCPYLNFSVPKKLLDYLYCVKKFVFRVRLMSQDPWATICLERYRVN